MLRHFGVDRVVAQDTLLRPDGAIWSRAPDHRGGSSKASTRKQEAELGQRVARYIGRPIIREGPPILTPRLAATTPKHGAG